jgi:hypothetical protein
VLLGGAGSGKTEIALALALRWAEAFERVHLVDFDFVTPYFRSQDVRAELGQAGVTVVASPPEYAGIDVPVLPQEIAAVVADPRNRVLFDVGGDPIGATTLGQFRPLLQQAQAAVYLVLNGRRPGAREAIEVARLADQMSAASRLGFDGVIANSNLGPETTPEVVAQGVDLAQEVAAQLGVPLALVCCLEPLADQVSRHTTAPVLPVKVQLRLPWNV